MVIDIAYYLKLYDDDDDESEIDNNDDEDDTIFLLEPKVVAPKET
jgi:hypothetical protein